MAKPTTKKGNTGRDGKGAWKPRRWRPTPIRSRKTGLAAVKHQQAQAQIEAERAAATVQRGRAFTALAHVVAAASDRPTAGKPASHPHRPPSVGQNMGLNCEHCRNVFKTGQDLKRHYAGGCPALKAG